MSLSVATVLTLSQLVFVANSVSLGLLTGDGGKDVDAPYLSSRLTHPLKNYLQLTHLYREETTTQPRTVRPHLLTRPLLPPDPRPRQRSHPYSLLYLHFVPI
ncbi:uncharacterized protein [Cherax quadricarinatus]|uniref:uncharacterized protein n=1 Tax=Cherax quadricarinatus TaxID=27406 RepID=UPI00387E669C